MLLCKRDVVSFMMRDALGTFPLLSLASHCLVFGCALTGALLAAAPVANLSAKSFNYVILRTTLVSASKCVAVKSDHFLVSTSVDFVRA